MTITENNWEKKSQKKLQETKKSIKLFSKLMCPLWYGKNKKLKKTFYFKPVYKIGFIYIKKKKMHSSKKHFPSA